MSLPLKPMAVFGLLKELRVATTDDKPLAVGGALAAQLEKELVKGGDARAVRTGGPEGAAAYVHVLAAAPSDEDEAVLKRAHRARVPIVALARERYHDVPYVLATDVVVVPPGRGFPLDALAHALAARLGEHGTSLAARLPVLRPAVCEWLIASFARKNGILAAAVFVPGADLPVLTLNQMRLVLRLAAAHGVEVSNDRLPELVAVLGGGLGLRAVARELADLVPGVGWAVKGTIAYTGTRALGEAAVRYFAARIETEGAGPSPAPSSRRGRRLRRRRDNATGAAA
jgi:uncharacterized protein (DUF697 family)